jgi:hypothetical protein
MPQVYVSIFICKYVNMYVCILYIHVYICIYTYICIYMYIVSSTLWDIDASDKYMNIYIDVYIYACIYIYVICIYIYIYICIYTYIHISLEINGKVNLVKMGSGEWSLNSGYLIYIYVYIYIYTYI